MPYEQIVGQLVPPEEYMNSIADLDVLHVISRARFHHAGREPVKPQRLIALGSSHINVPEYWYYEPATEIFHTWEEATRESDRVLIAEGDQDLWGLGETLGHAISEHYSSVGLQCLLAESYDIPIISGEPPNYSDIGQLMLEFSPEEVLLHYGIIQIPLLHGMPGPNKPSLDEFMEGQMFPSYRRQLGKLALTLPDSHPLHDFDFTYRNFRDLYRKYFREEPSAEDSALNNAYLRITCAQLEPPDFATRPIARVAPRRRDLRYGHLGAVQAALWTEKQASSFIWRGLLHTLELDEYLAQFGHATRLPIKSWEVHDRTKNGYLLSRNGKLGPTAHKWDPWDFSPAACSERPRPPYLLEPHGPPPDKATKARIKAYFSKRAAEPIGPSPYITHLTKPFEEWKEGFSTMCKQLEATADVLMPNLRAPYHRIKGQTGREREHMDGLLDNPRVAPLFFAGDSRICDALLAGCLRLSSGFCHKLSDYASFNRRTLQLFERFAASAQDIQHATVAFDAASKHLTVLVLDVLRRMSEIGLTPTEELHYALAMLEYELLKRH